MKCDFCDKEMDVDETGIMLMEYRMAGHMICAIRVLKWYAATKVGGNES